jgi:hypothetical protein
MAYAAETLSGFAFGGGPLYERVIEQARSTG